MDIDKLMSDLQDPDKQPEKQTVIKIEPFELNNDWVHDEINDLMVNQELAAQMGMTMGVSCLKNCNYFRILTNTPVDSKSIRKRLYDTPGVELVCSRGKYHVLVGVSRNGLFDLDRVRADLIGVVQEMTNNQKEDLVLIDISNDPLIAAADEIETLITSDCGNNTDYTLAG